MKTFTINQHVRRHIGPALHDRFPQWTRADVWADGDEMTVAPTITDEETATINEIISHLQPAPKEGAKANSFDWMKGSQARSFKRAMDSRKRVRR